MMNLIELMAREAGLHEARKNPPYFGASVEALERFAELVRADEREACAKVCEEPTEQIYEVTTSWDGFESTRQMRMPKTDRDCAAAIRARSNT